VTWSSSDPSVGAVTFQGMFVAVGEGVCQISAGYRNLPPATTEVTVAAPGLLPTADWYPLGFGYRWTYTGTQVNPGQVGPAQEITLTILITKQVVREGLVWWELTISGSDPGAPPRYMYIRHDEDGMVEWLSDGEPVYRLKDPLIEGHNWLDPNSAEHRFTIESTTDAVVVPAGSFDNCIRLREHEGRGDPPFDVVAWFAQGVGIVKEQTWVEDQMIEEQELVSVEFGPP